MSQSLAIALVAVSFGCLFICCRLLGKTENLLIDVNEKIAENKALLNAIESWGCRHQDHKETPSEFERMLSK